MGYLNPIQAELQQGGAKPPGLLAMPAARQSSEEQQFSALANANAGTTTGAELQSAAEAALLGEEVPARVQAALKAPDAGALLAVKQAVDAALEVESVAAWLQQQGRSSMSWKVGLACARLVGLELTGVAELERLGKHVAREAALVSQKLQQLEVKRRHQANKIGKRKAGAEIEASLERLLASHRDACAQLRCSG